MAVRHVEQRVDHLAALVEQDIYGRGLRAGDRYLTTQEVAGLLGVSTRLANDAMRVLAARHVLTRRPKAGTVVGPAVRVDEDEEARAFDVIHLLIRQDYFFAERDRMEAIVTGLLHELPRCNIQFTFVPAFNEMAHVERLLRAGSATRNAYLIAVKSPQLQGLFEAQPSPPAVLLGTPFQGIRRLPWIDKDQREIGRILAQRLVRMGHRRIGVVLRDRRGYGDDLMVDAVTHEALAANLGSGALVVRSVPTEPDLTDLAVRGMLMNPDRPTGLICRTRMILASAARQCEALGLRIGSDMTLALCDLQSGPQDIPAVPCLRPLASIDAVGEGRLVGQMLGELSRGQTPDPDHHVIPVTLPA